MQTLAHSTMFGEHAELIDQARAGEIDGLIEYCYQRIRGKAYRMVAGFRAAYGARLDADDLMQEAALQMVLRMGAALASDHPIPFLLRNAWGAMLKYAERYQSLIATPNPGHGNQARRVMSLDAPLPGADDLTLLDVIGGADVSA